MESILWEYFPILIFLGIAIVLAGLFIFAAWLVAKQNPDSEKLSAYECGFEAFSGHRWCVPGETGLRRCVVSSNQP